MTPDEIRARLQRLGTEPRRRAEFRAFAEHYPSLKPAAVLVPLTERDGRLDVVLTKRSEKLRKHSGEVSFPGGRMDDTDHSLEFTALREAHEEIALLPDDVSVYGALLRMPTVTGFEVTMYVGEFASPYELDPNPAEIDTLIEAPLNFFGDLSNRAEREVEWNGQMFPTYSYDVDGHTVWGATAYMLVQLMEFLTEGPR